MSSETPYYNLHIPSPLSSFNQERLGMIELDSTDGIGIVSHGSIIMDSGTLLSSTDNTNVPSLAFSASNVNISGTTLNVNGGIVLQNVSNVSGLGVNYSDVVPSSSLVVPWYKQGGLYVINVSNSLKHVVKVLCVMP